MKFKVRAISFILMSIMLLSVFPTSIFANQNPNSIDPNVNQNTKNDYDISDVNYSNDENNTASNKSTPVKEDISKRDEFTKHFLCDDGSYIAVVYAEAIHYKDETKSQDEQWVEIDNTLTLDSKTKTYKNENSNPNFKVALADSINSENLVSIEQDGYSISWFITADKQSNEKSANTKVSAASSVAEIKISIKTQQKKLILREILEKPYLLLHIKMFSVKKMAQ